jgi:hypothetical protein
MIDLGERAVLSVLVQRGGKLPELKSINGAWRIVIGRNVDPASPFQAIDLVDIYEPPRKLRQFNSRTIADLAARGLVRQRRIFVEITSAGRDALGR